MKDQTHLVLDLETLSVKPDALILSIGFALVKDCNIVAQNEYRLRMSEQAHRHVSHDTIKWWLAGDKAAAQQHLMSLPEYCVGVAADMMHNTVTTYTTWDKVRVWGNSPSFDCVLLTNLYEDVLKKPTPWKFWNERDMRTLRDVYPHQRTVPKIPHSAMWDAVAEAEDLIQYLRSL